MPKQYAIYLNVEQGKSEVLLTDGAWISQASIENNWMFKPRLFPGKRAADEFRMRAYGNSSTYQTREYTGPQPLSLEQYKARCA